MGMYDYVVCRAPLPGVSPKWMKDGHPFQTKDFDCQMETYTIEADGRFSLPDFTGVIGFYDSNIVASGPALYTRDGEDIESVEYIAEIANGVLTNLGQVDYTAQAAFPFSKQHPGYKPPTAEEIKSWHELQEQDWAGKRLYVLWGGQETGYWVRVKLQRGRQVCVEHEEDSRFHKQGDLELLGMEGIGRTIWESEENALRRTSEKQKRWDKDKAEYEAYVTSKGGVRRTRR